MPLSFHHQINEVTKIGVWHITEPEDFFLKNVTLQRAITHPHKRLQHLAGRYLLLTLFPEFPLELISIADTRKPFLPGEPFHFSISHCGDYAAAIVSKLNRVGVDIEVPHPKIEKVKHKFLAGTEMELLAKTGEENNIMLTMAWSIKEAIFKWFGEGEMEFKGHMEIVSVEKSINGFETLCLMKKNTPIALSIDSTFAGANILSWIVT